MLQATKVEHADTPVLAAAHKHVDTLGAEPYIVHLLVMCNELCLGGQGWNIPNGAGGIDARGDDQAGRDRVPVQRRQRGGVIGRLGVGKQSQGRQLGDGGIAAISRRYGATGSRHLGLGGQGPQSEMVARGGEQIGRLLLGRWRLPQKTGNGVRVSRLRDPCEVHCELGGARGVDIGGCGRQVRVQDLNLCGWLSAWS